MRVTRIGANWNAADGTGRCANVGVGLARIPGHSGLRAFDGCTRGGSPGIFG